MTDDDDRVGPSQPHCPWHYWKYRHNDNREKSCVNHPRPPCNNSTNNNNNNNNNSNSNNKGR